MSLGERVKEVRKDNAITQNDFANRMLVSASYISKVEAGKEKPSDIFLKLMSLEFNISLEWLTTGNGTKYILKKQYDYFERTENYNVALEESLIDFQKTISMLPSAINSSIYFMLEEYSHLLKSQYLETSQKILIASIIADIFVSIIELTDKFFVTNTNDKKELLRFEKFSQEIGQTILVNVNEIKNSLIPEMLK